MQNQVLKLNNKKNEDNYKNINDELVNILYELYV